MNLSIYLPERQRMLLDALAIEQAFAELAKHGVEYKEYYYCMTKTSIQNKLKELLEVASKNQLSLLIMTLTSVLKQME